MVEQWRPIAGFEGLYEVSDAGRVRSLERVVVRSDGQRQHVRERLLALTPNTSGYLQVALRSPGRRDHLRVHRLVLEAFVGPCPEGMEARHLDGVRTNAALSNLLWGTPLENAADKGRHGTQVRGEAHAASKLTAEQVREIRDASGEAQRAVAQRYGVSQSLVSHIRRGEAWRHVE